MTRDNFTQAAVFHFPSTIKVNKMAVKQRPRLLKLDFEVNSSRSMLRFL